MSAAILGLQLRSIFAWAAFFARCSRSGSIKTPIAFETAQHANAQGATLAAQPIGIIARVPHHNGVLGQVSEQTFELDESHLDGCCVRCYPLLLQQVGPATGFFRQNHDGRKLPPKRDWFLTFWQVMHVLRRPIRRSHGFWTRNTTGIDADPLPFPCARLWPIVSEDLSQAFFINASVFKRLVQARPFPLKPQRLRHFGKRLGLRCAHQSIHGIKQRVSRPQKTVIEIVTKLAHYVNVSHTSKLPLFDDRNLLDQATLRKVGGLLSEIV
jgi:hypothetical protein